MPSLYHKSIGSTVVYADGGASGTDEVSYPGGGLIWTGIAHTVGGTATFYPTDDGTPTGTPLFSAIDTIQVTPSRNVSKAIFVPLASVKSVSLDFSTIVANVVQGDTLIGGVGGNTLQFADDQILVYALVIGVT